MPSWSWEEMKAGLHDIREMVQMVMMMMMACGGGGGGIPLPNQLVRE